MAIPVEITTQVLKDAAKFIYLQIRGARANMSGLVGPLRLKLEIDEISKGPDGGISVKGLKANGPADEVVSLMLGMLNGGDSASAIEQAKHELDSSGAAGQAR